MDENQFKKKLTPEQYHIMREKGTEAPFTGKYVHEEKEGMYVCAACGNELFSSDAKFDSGTGWPSFTDAANRKNVELREDKSGGLSRVEVVCKNCGSHLGHVFDDGPADKGGKRFCINSACLELKEKEENEDEEEDEEDEEENDDNSKNENDRKNKTGKSSRMRKMGQVMSLIAAAAVGASSVYGYLALTDFPRPGLCPSEIKESAAVTPVKTTSGVLPKSSTPTSPVQSTTPTVPDGTLPASTGASSAGSADGTRP